MLLIKETKEYLEYYVHFYSVVVLNQTDIQDQNLSVPPRGRSSDWTVLCHIGPVKQKMSA